MQTTLDPNHLAELSRSRERLNNLAFWGVTALLAACVASSLYNVLNVAQPWLRFGQFSGLCFVLYLLGPALQRGASRQGAHEPSGHFLVRTHEERRQGYLWIRSRLYWAIPSMAASWWGVRQANPQGFHAWPFLATGACLIVVWLALGKAAEKAARDAAEVRGSLSTDIGEG